ncbi:hypothetical protein [uncultured Helicobacter sp.]|nr:hypothetical protein [uncultured Helicobacter sp.]
MQGVFCKKRTFYHFQSCIKFDTITLAFCGYGLLCYGVTKA